MFAEKNEDSLAILIFGSLILFSESPHGVNETAGCLLFQLYPLMRLHDLIHIVSIGADDKRKVRKLRHLFSIT